MLIPRGDILFKVVKDLISAKYVAWHGGDFTKESVRATTKAMKNKPSVKMWDYVQCT